MERAVTATGPTTATAQTAVEQSTAPAAAEPELAAPTSSPVVPTTTEPEPAAPNTAEPELAAPTPLPVVPATAEPEPAAPTTTEPVPAAPTSSPAAPAVAEPDPAASTASPAAPTGTEPEPASVISACNDQGLLPPAVGGGVPKPRIEPVSHPEPGYPLVQRPQELSGGQLERWSSRLDIVLDGFMDWLFVEDPEIREFAELEQAMYRHHFEGGTGAVLWSIMQQAMRQDLGLYVLAVVTHPSRQTTLVTHNLPTDATQYRAEISLTGEPGDLRFAFARPEVRLHGLKVSTSWVDVRDDCHNLTDSRLSS